MTLNGSPLVQRVRPAMLQPPMTASSQPGTFAAPLPAVAPGELRHPVEVHLVPDVEVGVRVLLVGIPRVDQEARVAAEAEVQRVRETSFRSISDPWSFE